MIESQTIGKHKSRIVMINQEFNGWSFAPNFYWTQVITQIVSIHAEYENSMKESLKSSINVSKLKYIKTVFE